MLEYSSRSMLSLRVSPVCSRETIHCPFGTCDKSHYEEDTLKVKVEALIVCTAIGNLGHSLKQLNFGQFEDINAAPTGLISEDRQHFYTDIAPTRLQCIAIENLGYALKHDYERISLSLKGGSDAETKTKEIHLRI